MEDERAPSWPPVDINNFGQVGSSGVHWQQHSCMFAISENPAEIRSWSNDSDVSLTVPFSTTQGSPSRSSCLWWKPFRLHWWEVKYIIFAKRCFSKSSATIRQQRFVVQLETITCSECVVKEGKSTLPWRLVIFSSTDGTWGWVQPRQRRSSISFSGQKNWTKTYMVTKVFRFLCGFKVYKDTAQPEDAPQKMLALHNSAKKPFSLEHTHTWKSSVTHKDQHF